MEDRCVICGEIVPEGTHVCKKCQNKCDEMLPKMVKQAKKDKLDWYMIFVWGIILLFSIGVLYGLIYGGLAVIGWLAEVLR